MRIDGVLEMKKLIQDYINCIDFKFKNLILNILLFDFLWMEV